MKEKWFITAKGADFQAIGNRFHIDPVIARLIRNRDVTGEDAVDVYLHGGLENLHAPWLMKDMKRSVEILSEKIRLGKKIRIIGDYDIDGVCATYILKEGLDCLGADADCRIPERIRDGYGINSRLITMAKEDGVDTIVTCDNGISAREEIACAKSLGMTVIVTDHHEVPFEDVDGEKHFLLPPADAIVNPKQRDCDYPDSGLCGGAVAYKLVEALFEENRIPKDRLLPLLQFAAVATVGDVMDLTGENRILVRQGLERIHQTAHPGLLALCGVNHLSREEITAYHIGFILGPCLNASGRLDTAKRALALLRENDSARALSLAEDLKSLNDSRKQLTERAVDQAMEMIRSTPLGKDPVLVVYLRDCHESIAGIVAGRIREACHKPAFVITKGEQSLKGSGRSIAAYSMFEKLQECKDLLLNFGGHPMAAGLSLEEENLPELRRRLNENCGLTEEDFAEKVVIDMQMPLGYISERLVRQLALLEPYGKGNTKPLFAEKDLYVERGELIGKNKNVLKMNVTALDGTKMTALCFRDAQKAYEYIQNKRTITVAYYPQISEFRGQKSLQIVIAHYY